MTTITQLHTPQEAAQWLRARVTGRLQVDSRQAGAGDGFIAWPGAATDGRRFVRAALAQGAAACLVERQGMEAFELPASEQVACYAGLKAVTGLVADAYYDAPSRALDVVAFTGTNGKTSSAWWLAAALSEKELPGHGPCALVGTLGMGVPPALQGTGMTTPDPVRMHRHFRAFADAGVRACAMEASSIGIAEQRLTGTAIRVAVFTNFTQDHLDYHGSMQAYWEAKAALFAWPGLSAAVINMDDAKGAELARQANDYGLDVWTFSLHQPNTARLHAEALVQRAQGLSFTVREEGAAAHTLATALIGEYNVSNLLGVIGALRALGVPLADAVRACAHLPAVPGRMEQIAQPGAPLAVVDYAHTPDALDKALAALRPLAQARGGRLWAVFGCGGNRDAGKRPLMAAAAEARADRVCLTSDNPRGEAPEAIIDDMRRGLRAPGAARVQADRARAIADALAEAAPADVVLIAGKGHEDYQEVQGERRPFSDQAEARRALAAR
ncbi:MAG: UDP-N-acetylmuramoyl-L-alanyl-D-glutamate--2,6-diaminopimelate ligase, partial [Comamonadaceae bacterium]|nr:UDP-N-acetylmuramoyl-L-alanyl-D-glutamate--2,6-diaminopimelate ligase [Comamonadaceae bacterium]